MKDEDLKEDDFFELMKRWKMENFMQNFDGFNHFFKRINFVKSNKKFVEWARDEKIIGNGTSEDPFIIDSSVKLPEKAFLANVDLFILIDSRDFDLLNLLKFENITIKNCRFAKLTFTKCRDITIMNSEINALNVLKSKDLTFEKCKISVLFDYLSKMINYADCEIKLDYFKEKGKLMTQIPNFIEISKKNVNSERNSARGLFGMVNSMLRQDKMKKKEKKEEREKEQ